MMPSLPASFQGSSDVSSRVMAAVFAALRDHECTCKACELLRGVSDDLEKLLTKK